MLEDATAFEQAGNQPAQEQSNYNETPNYENHNSFSGGNQDNTQQQPQEDTDFSSYFENNPNPLDSGYYQQQQYYQQPQYQYQQYQQPQYQQYNEQQYYQQPQYQQYPQNQYPQQNAAMYQSQPQLNFQQQQQYSNFTPQQQQAVQNALNLGIDNEKALEMVDKGEISDLLNMTAQKIQEQIQQQFNPQQMQQQMQQYVQQQLQTAQLQYKAEMLEKEIDTRLTNDLSREKINVNPTMLDFCKNKVAGIIEPAYMQYINTYNLKRSTGQALGSIPHNRNTGGALDKKEFAILMVKDEIRKALGVNKSGISPNKVIRQTVNPIHTNGAQPVTDQSLLDQINNISTDDPDAFNKLQQLRQRRYNK